MINPFLRRIKKGTVYEGSSQHSGKESVRIFPLGGTGNVTKNMFVYEYRYDGKLRDILIVDCGIGFPDAEMFGVDLVLPDVRYLEDKKGLIRGLVFTTHDDHIGGIAHLYPKLACLPAPDRRDGGQENPDVGDDFNCGFTNPNLPRPT
jgi:glyoxylase-like metal-dependent hydrolase (beta-lactamase superfamily II)